MTTEVCQLLWRRYLVIRNYCYVKDNSFAVTEEASAPTPYKYRSNKELQKLIT